MLTGGANRQLHRGKQKEEVQLGCSGALQVGLGLGPFCRKHARSVVVTWDKNSLVPKKR